MSEAPGRQFYERHLRFLQNADVDSLIEYQYHDDAALISFNGIIRGRDALHAYFLDYMKSIGGSLTLKSTDRFIETDDSIFFEATLVVPSGEVRVYDVFMMRDGKITHHFPGVIAIKPHDQSQEENES
ncbi:MAG: nuclear transport factor 2 family protein [Chloroflexi bacterium]|nr:nuclear transport factor 2 family protein [Chloroflexota bacterium]